MSTCPCTTSSPPATRAAVRRPGGQGTNRPLSALAPAVEQALGRQWVAGRQAEAQLQALRAAGQPIPQQLGARLPAQVRAGRQARARLIMACTPLVERLAQQYSGYSVPYDDLLQEGL